MWSTKSWLNLGPASWLALLLIVVVSACGTRRASSTHIDPLLETLIPPDTVFVTGANLDAIRSTPVFQRYISQLRLPQMDDFIQRTGLDPRKDLSQILSASNGKTGVFMARGKFDPKKIEPELEKNGAARTSYKGYDVFGDDRQAVLFIGSSTAVAGPAPELKSMIDDRDKPTHGLPPELRRLLQTVDPDRQVWAVFSGSLPGVNLGVPEDSTLGQVAQVLRGIQEGTVGIDLRKGVDFKSDLICRTDNDARHLHDAIRAVIGIVRLSTRDDRPDLLRLYDAIKVEQIQTRVDITAQVAPEVEDKFLDLWLKQHPAR